MRQGHRNPETSVDSASLDASDAEADGEELLFGCVWLLVRPVLFQNWAMQTHSRHELLSLTTVAGNFRAGSRGGGGLKRDIENSSKLGE